MAGYIGSSQPISVSTGSVESDDILDDAVTSAKILDGTVVAADILNGTITADKLATGINLVVGDIDFTSGIMRGGIVPDTDAAYDIGSSEKKIRDLYVSSNSLWVGDNHKVSIKGGKPSFRKRKKGKTPKKMFDVLIGVGKAFDNETALKVKFKQEIHDPAPDTTLDPDHADFNPTVAKWLVFSALHGYSAFKRAEDIFDDDDDYTDDGVSISTGGVGTSEIAANAITSTEIADNAVGSSEIADDAVTASHILNGTITESKLDPTINLGGWVSKTINANTTLDTNTEYTTGSSTIITDTITLTIPTSSNLVVKNTYQSGKQL